MASHTPALKKMGPADSRKLRDPAFAERFLIGAEFEIYFKPSSPPSGRSSRARSRGPSRFEASRFEILAMLSSDHPGHAWEREISFCRDSSLSRPRPGEAGVEIVLRHSRGSKALALIGKILLSLSASPKVRTSSDCGLHFNASFADSRLNAAAILSSIHEHAPVDEMLSRFGRSRNAYCRDNSKDTIEREEFCVDQGPDLLELIGQSAGGRKIGRGGEVSLLHLSEALSSLSNPAVLANFQRLALFKAKAILANRWGNDRPACAPRLSEPAELERSFFSPSSANYCEFRMIGGKGYQHRAFDVAATMQQCLTAMERAATATSPDLQRLARPAKLRG